MYIERYIYKQIYNIHIKIKFTLQDMYTKITYIQNRFTYYKKYKQWSIYIVEFIYNKIY